MNSTPERPGGDTVERTDKAPAPGLEELYAAASEQFITDVMKLMRADGGFCLRVTGKEYAGHIVLIFHRDPCLIFCLESGPITKELREQLQEVGKRYSLFTVVARKTEAGEITFALMYRPVVERIIAVRYRPSTAAEAAAAEGGTPRAAS